jgi:hypothetical protein
MVGAEGTTAEVMISRATLGSQAPGARPPDRLSQGHSLAPCERVGGHPARLEAFCLGPTVSTVPPPVKNLVAPGGSVKNSSASVGGDSSGRTLDSSGQISGAGLPNEGPVWRDGQGLTNSGTRQGSRSVRGFRPVPVAPISLLHPFGLRKTKATVPDSP